MSFLEYWVHNVFPSKLKKLYELTPFFPSLWFLYEKNTETVLIMVENLYIVNLTLESY